MDDQTNKAVLSPGKSRAGVATSWGDQYSAKHRPRRLTAFPQGIAPPRRVRVYQRYDYYLLQWWEKSEKRTASERVDGDLLAVLSRARVIDERLEQMKTGAAVLADYRPLNWCGSTSITSGAGPTRGKSIRGLCRAIAALEHFVEFVQQPSTSRRYRTGMPGGFDHPRPPLASRDSSLTDRRLGPSFANRHFSPLVVFAAAFW